MSEASSLLKRVMDTYPEVAKLARQKADMVKALREKGWPASQTVSVFDIGKCLYAMQYAIEEAIEENKYTHDFGTEDSPLTLSSLLAEAVDWGVSNGPLKSAYLDKVFVPADDYTTFTFVPFVPSGLLSSILEHAFENLYGLLYFAPQPAFSEVLTIKNSFTVPAYLPETYIINCKKITCVIDSPARLGKKLILTNMRSDYANLTIQNSWRDYESIVGLNLSAVSNPKNLKSNFDGKSGMNPKHMEFASGSYIQYGNVLINGETISEPDTYKCSYFQEMDAETLYTILDHAYDWTTNPNGLKRSTDTGAKTRSFFYDDTTKSKLEAAYPSVDFTKMMEDKGWTY